MDRLYPYLFLFLSISVFGQDGRIKVSGVVKKDSLFVEDVHVINKTSSKGTLTNRLGAFQISVKERDTLIISDIQYNNQILIVDQEMLAAEFLEIRLQESNTELDEVIVRQYENMAEELGLPNAGKKPLNKLERNLNHYSQKSTPMVILETLLFKPGGIDDLYNIISGNRKNDRKLRALIEKDRQDAENKNDVQIIREYFKDEFFLAEVKIPDGHINNYITYCLPKNLKQLFDQGRMIEVIDILLKNKEPYLQSLVE